MSKILAIDVGAKRVGFAISDELCLLARPLETVAYSETLGKIFQFLEEEEIETIVVGFPRNLEGLHSEKAEFVEKFAQLLKEKVAGDIKIEFEDESGTSVIAEERLKKQKVDFRKDKGLVDREAAAVILESYMERIRNE